MVSFLPVSFSVEFLYGNKLKKKERKKKKNNPVRDPCLHHPCCLQFCLSNFFTVLTSKKHATKKDWL